MKDYLWINHNKIGYKQLEKTLGRKKFETLLKSRIERDLNGYKVYVKDVNASLIGEEFLDMLDIRDFLEAEINELSKTKDINDFQKTLEELDKQFKEQKEICIKKFSGLTETPDAPKTQWWRHLKTYDSK